MAILRFPQLQDPPEPRHAILNEQEEPAELADAMRRIAKGDRAALDTILNAYFGEVVGYASRMVGDLDTASDIAQETFCRLWTRGDWHSGSVRAYLYRLARNVAIDELRRRESRARAELKSDIVEGPPAASPETVTEEHELIGKVDAAIQSLPPRRREAFTLVYFQGLTYREAAEIMDISVKTLGNQLGAAVSELRSHLNQYRD